MKANKGGKLVILEDGRRGFIYNELGTHNGKYLVYLIDSTFKKTGEKLLCSPESITIVGYFD